MTNLILFSVNLSCTLNGDPNCKSEYEQRIIAKSADDAIECARRIALDESIPDTDTGEMDRWTDACLLECVIIEKNIDAIARTNE